METAGTRTSIEKSSTAESNADQLRPDGPHPLMARYEIDCRHAAAHFKVRHMMISWVQGEFSRIAGSVEFDPSNLAAAHVEATIDPATVSTRDIERDRHLRSPDFLDVGRYPSITFHSTKIAAIGISSYKVVGELTIRGVTREITLQVYSLTPEIRDPEGL